jgi:4-oxalocrotonate tautomerase
MRDQRAHWATESRMRTHNAWHLAMFDAEEGNVASALGILDAWLLPASARSALDACDATALLWRLAIEGVEDDGRWCGISDAFERTMTPGFWPYVDLHAGLAHLTAGKRERWQRLVRAIARCAEGGSHAAMRARHITQPGLRALDAWAEGRYGEAARLLAGLQPVLGDAGGSRVQLEIFKSIEHEAARRQRARHCEQPQPPSAKEQVMPFINVKLIEGVFSDPQKKEIAKSLTDALVRIEGEALRSVTWCVVEEVKSGDWAVGGKPLTTTDVKAIAARKAA